MQSKQFQKRREKQLHVIRGVLSVNSRAVGFIEDPNKGDDLMIETPNLATALNRDEVEVELLKEKVRGRRTGRVARIIKRAKTRFVGTIEERGTQLVVVPDDFRMYAPIVILLKQAEPVRAINSFGIDLARPPREARPGYKALVELREWKTGEKPLGEILRIIGKKGEHEVEMESIVLERGFESAFPREAEAEAERIAEEARRLLERTGTPIPAEEIKNRRDFRSATLFTIDPANAKDFDDALSFRKLPRSDVKDKARPTEPSFGRGLRIKDSVYEVGVHIADVSHYVREGTALDQEARERGTSVYLVDRTIPMLPHALSNDLCSLNPDVDRLAFSAVFEMDAEGRVHTRWFGKSVIHSQKRFTYESAQELIDGHLQAGGLLEDAHLVEALQTLNTIAKKLRAEKAKKGAIDFEQDEVGFELDEKGRPLRVFKKKRLDTHKLVEEFMLLANREVAEYFWLKHTAKGGMFARPPAKAGGLGNASHDKPATPFIYRIHDMPDRERLEQLGIFVRALGHELPMRKDARPDEPFGRGRVTGKDLQALFSAIEGHASESLIKTAAIRSMAKAVYSTRNIGHFGLAFEYYTHFTSPIRRYPDLLVHRSLFSILERHPFNPQKLALLERMAKDATQKEIAAAEAERESIKLKQVEYMAERTGKEFDGIISGVTEWGIYVEEKETRSEGMVKLRDLQGDYFTLDEGSYSVVGQRTKKRYSLGDRVRFKVVGADVERKTLDYRIVSK